jgi:hypothetical protein
LAPDPPLKEERAELLIPPFPQSSPPFAKGGRGGFPGRYFQKSKISNLPYPLFGKRGNSSLLEEEKKDFGFIFRGAG